MPTESGTIDRGCPLPSSWLGHNLSHADANSNEGESKNPSQTDTSACYPNFDQLPNRHRRSNSSQIPCLPTSEGPPVPMSPASQKRLLELAPSEEQQLQTVVTAPLAEDETQLIPNMPMGFILPEVSCQFIKGFVFFLLKFKNDQKHTPKKYMHIKFFVFGLLRKKCLYLKIPYYKH